ncbi:MAG TPA: class I tRNA ligase family protein, partial [Tepidiformaceae bacterium]|nr:class I tRNA ligase family protein [Tepidiformaceae bacterium]
MSERVLVCVAWPYANYLLHVGQAAGAYLPADIFARYSRLSGKDVLMVSGSDCHGTPITVSADRDGVTPRDIVDRYHPKILEVWERLGISFDLFTTTLTENHYAVTQDVFLRLHEKGLLY